MVDIEVWKKANGNGAVNEVKEKNQEIGEEFLNPDEKMDYAA